LTRKLARLHGGDVTVVSTLGKGSSFTLFLPDKVDLIAPNHEANQVTTTSTPLPASPNKKRILLAEQEQNTAILLQDYLEIIGYQVEWLNNAANFLEQVRSFQPKLILLDEQSFKVVDKGDLLKLLKQEDDLQNIPVVIICESEDDFAEFANFHINNYGYLVKPIRIVQLESILMQYLS
jgi:PleD family two-component response regulator